jgi:hypothetical protein
MGPEPRTVVVAAVRRPAVIEISVQLRPDVARALAHRGPPTTESAGVLDAAARLGVALEPLHPGADDPLLAPHYVARASGTESAEALRRALAEVPGIDGAWMKPADELP